MVENNAGMEAKDHVAVAKEFLDLIRAALNTLTWTALSIGVSILAWSTAHRTGGGSYLFAGISIVVATLTTAAALYSLWVVVQAFRKRLSTVVPIPIRLGLAFLGPIGLYFFGGTAMIVLVIPIFKTLLGLA